MAKVWQPQGLSFAEVVRGKPTKKQIYTGEGEDDVMDDLSMADIIQPEMEE